MRTLTLIAGLVASLIGARADADPYRVAGRIKGPDGGWDYASIDSASRWLFVARGYGVMAVDLASGAVTSKLVEGAGVHGVLPLPGSTLAISTNGKSNDALLFDRSTGRIEMTIQTGGSPDALLIEPNTGLVVIFNGKSRDATLFDPSARAVVGAIALNGKPEAGAADGAGRVFVNLEDKAEIAVIDVAGRKVVGAYALPGCEAPTGLAYEPERKLLISACDNKIAKLIDAATGKDLGGLPIGAHPDAVLVDGARRRALVPAGEGALTVVDIAAGHDISVLETVPTQKGARTAALDAATGDIYLPTAQFAPPESDGARPKPVAGTFEILVVSPMN
jgi:DNA-binding beta-propeller fold protein YncE